MKKIYFLYLGLLVLPLNLVAQPSLVTEIDSQALAKQFLQQSCKAGDCDRGGNEFGGFGASRGLAIEANESPAASSLNFKIEFKSGSADLKYEGLELLNDLVDVIRMPELADVNFLIIGHTDAVGSEPFNQDLSEMRALSVVRYMTRLEPSLKARLSLRGMGESQPLDTSNPEASVNRRVEIKALTYSE